MITDILTAVFIVFLICADTAAVTRISSHGQQVIREKAEVIRETTEGSLAVIGTCEICTETEEDPDPSPAD